MAIFKKDPPKLKRADLVKTKKNSICEICDCFSHNLWKIEYSSSKLLVCTRCAEEFEYVCLFPPGAQRKRN